MRRAFILAGIRVQSDLQPEGGQPSAVEDRVPSVKDISLLLARFACNNHTICDEELRPVIFDLCGNTQHAQMFVYNDVPAVK
jgi:hypothetical protein